LIGFVIQTHAGSFGSLFFILKSNEKIAVEGDFSKKQFAENRFTPRYLHFIQHIKQHGYIDFFSENHIPTLHLTKLNTYATI